MKQYQHYIKGAWTDPDSGEWFDTENPYTGEVWADWANTQFCSALWGF